MARAQNECNPALIHESDEAGGAVPAISSSGARSAVAVVFSDSTDLAVLPRALYIGVSGDLEVTLADDTTGTHVVFKAVPVGILPVRAKRVWNTLTTATNVLALY